MAWSPSNEQVGAVTKYLNEAFPGFQIDVKYEDANMLHRFRVVERSVIEHELHVDRLIFDDETPNQITYILSVHSVAQKKMREAGSTPVRVSKHGRKVVVS